VTLRALPSGLMYPVVLPVERILRQLAYRL